jgi:hypothetical protein
MDDENDEQIFNTFAPICIPFFFNWIWIQFSLNSIKFELN